MTAGTTDVLPQGYVQERVYYTQLLSGARSWLFYRSWRVRGPLDVSALNATLRSLVARHEVMRTVILPGDEPRQRVLPPDQAEISLVCQQLVGVGEQDVHRYVRRLLRRVGRESDLWQYPTFRFFLLRVSPVDHVFIAAFQHLMVDGTAIATLERELWELYAQHAKGTPIAERGGPSFTDVSQRQRGQHERRQRAASRYWSSTVAGFAPVCQFNSDGPADVVRSERVVREVVLDGDDLVRVREILAAHRTSQLAVLLAALASTVFEFSRQDRVLVHVLLDPRATEAKGVVGLLAGNHPIAAHRGADLLDQMRAALLRTITYRSASADALVGSQFRDAERFGMRARRTISVDYRQVGDEPTEPDLPDGLSVERVTDLEYGPSPYSLRMIARDQPGRMVIRLDFAAMIFDDDGADEFARVLRDALTRPVRDFATAAPGQADRPATATFAPTGLTTVANADGDVLFSVDTNAVAELLNRHEAVRAASVRVDGDRVAATVVASRSVTVSELRQHCYAALATSQFVVVPGSFDISVDPGADPARPPAPPQSALLNLIRDRLPAASDEDLFWAAGGTFADIAAIRAQAAGRALPVPGYPVFAAGLTLSGIAATATEEAAEG